MQDYHRNQQEFADLRAAHFIARNVREGYRLNAAILLGSGWSPSEVAAAMLIDDYTVRAHFRRYKQGGIAAVQRMNYVGSEALLVAAPFAELDAHLQKQLHPSATSVARWIEVRFCVRYKTLKDNKGEHDASLFMDAIRAQHNRGLAGRWIKRGRSFALKGNTGRRRLNINGVIDVETQHALICDDETNDAESMIALFEQIEAAYPKAATLTAFCDNARYSRAKASGAYLERSRIDLEFLPLYARRTCT
jgi:hypothetical protein